MSTRTQIYLDEKQRRALKLLAASSDQSVSDLVRRAIERLLNDAFAGKDWAVEMDAAVDLLRSSGPNLSESEVIGAVEKRRKRQHPSKIAV